MEDSAQLNKENPINSANWVSRLIFLWMRKCTPKNIKEHYEVKDIHKCPDSFLSSINGTRIKKIWNEEKKKAENLSTKPSLIKVIFKTYPYEMLNYGVLAFINFIIIKGSQPVVLSKLIKLFMEKKYTMREMYIYAGGTCCLLILYTGLFYHIYVGYFLLAQKVRVAISSLVYEKILKLSQKSLDRATPGKIINLLSNDVYRFDQFLVYNFLWILPIQTLVTVAVLWNQFGVESLGGIVAPILFLIPFQSFMGRLTGSNYRKAAKISDQRMKIMNEIYSGMEVIKMYTWERQFERTVQEVRREEHKYLRRSAHIKALLGSVKFFIERVGLCLTALCYSFLGYPVLANMVFSVGIFFGMLQFSVGVMFPIAMTMGPELLVSADRLVDFLLLEEKEEADTAILEDGELGKIRLEKVFASYCDDEATMACPSVDISQGTLCAVVGRVGSGKSSFLKLLLGELPKDSGIMSMNGVISFSSQKPWLFSSTIRRNIVFDQKFDEFRYWETICACGLSKDLEQLPNSDRTVVGSRGVSLSGGQRARINLARAVYKRADIYLLDDVLSALDAKVGRHVFDECILKFLNGKTRIFVTHQLQYLGEADHILVFNKGILEAQGTLEEISNSSIQIIQSSSSPEDLNKENVDDQVTSKIDVEEKNQSTFSATLPDPQNKMDEKENIISSEKRRDKYIGSSLWSYIKSAKSYFNITSFIFMTLLSQLALVFSDYWLTFWSEQENKKGSKKFVGTSKEIVEAMPSYFERLLNSSLFIKWVDHIEVGYYQHVTLKIPILRLIYGVIVVSAVILIFIRSFLLTDTCMKASWNLHTKILGCLIGAPMKFFNMNPPGYTQNIFSKDLYTIDNHLPRTLLNVVGIISMLPGALCLIFISNYYMAVLILPMIAIVLRLSKWFLPSFDNFRRIEGRVKSPVFSYVSSTIDGISTIRASRSEASLTTQFDGYQDIHTSAMFLVHNFIGAFGLWIEYICIFFVCCTLLTFIIMDQYVYVSGSFIGLAIFQSISLLCSLQTGIRGFTETRNNLTSAERILDYTTLDTEVETQENEDEKNLKNWPSDGRISIQNLCLSYHKHENPVIRNLNLEILPSEKIGIAGRTGAGKSSIISVLFRITPFEGTILIDGVDTKTIRLKTLRERLSIIPQEPVIFSATIRNNLDPLQKYTDEKIWKALEEVELRESIKSLDFEVTEGGNNFSVGQKQLICLARALLKENKILILDEATANLDLRTDELIQKTIRRKFKNCTVLTVAHRLTSIMDSDRVLVMDSGRMVEFDHPHILLQDPNGNFHKLLEESKSRKKTYTSSADQNIS